MPPPSFSTRPSTRWRGSLRSILATLLYGIGSAAALVSQVKLLFPNLWLGLVVGVAAGLPRLSHPELSIRNTRLGDVLVAQPSSRRDALIAYDLGRVVDESGRLELLRDAGLWIIAHRDFKAALVAATFITADRHVLLWAAENGYETTVKLLLSVALNGPETIVKHLLASGKVNINAKNDEGETPLLIAARNGNKAIVQQLLASSVVDVDAADKNGITPLLWTAIDAHEAVGYQLLMRKANVDSDRKWLITRHKLLNSAEHGEFAVVKQILEQGRVNVNVTDACSRTSLRLAAANEQEAFVWQLLAVQKIGIDAQDVFEVNKHKDIVCQLLLNGARMEWEDPRPWLFLQCRWKYLRPGMLVVALGICFDPRLMSAKEQRTAIIRLLPDGSSFTQSAAQIDVELPGWYSRVLLFWAVEEQSEAIVTLLVNVRKVDVNGTDVFDRTALARCAMKGCESMVRLLLTESQLDVNAQDKDGRTALSWATANGHKAIVKLLIEHGGVVTIADKAGRDPATFAADKGRRNIVELLESKYSLEFFFGGLMTIFFGAFVIIVL
ncbi:hypothetical protein NHJ13734_006099 [Beauveria thailandica]